MFCSLWLKLSFHSCYRLIQLTLKRNGHYLLKFQNYSPGMTTFGQVMLRAGPLINILQPLWVHGKFATPYLAKCFYSGNMFVAEVNKIFSLPNGISCFNTLCQCSMLLGGTPIVFLFIAITTVYWRNLTFFVCRMITLTDELIAAKLKHVQVGIVSFILIF